jgi:hypothetical protein
MLVLGIARFRVGLLLLALALGLAGQTAYDTVPAAQTSIAQIAAAAPGNGCGGWESQDQNCTPLPVCAVSVCPGIPALPAQQAAVYPSAAAIFGVSLLAIGSGISTRPDPYPPRLLLGS